LTIKARTPDLHWRTRQTFRTNPDGGTDLTQLKESLEASWSVWLHTTHLTQTSSHTHTHTRTQRTRRVWNRNCQEDCGNRTYKDFTTFQRESRVCANSVK